MRILSHCFRFAPGLSRLALALLFCGAAGSALGAEPLLIAEPAAIALTAEASDDFSNGEATCARFGGELILEPDGEGLRQVCRDIDENGTFCIVGSKDVFPCRGLFKQVALCNGTYNRPARDPFVCNPRCGVGKFACGMRCETGTYYGARPNILVAPGYRRKEVFRITVAGRRGREHGQGRGRTRLLAADSALKVSVTNRAEAVAEFVRNPLAGRVYRLTLRAEFSCYGLEQFGGGRIIFTITAANIPRRMDFHTDFGDSGGLTVVNVRGLRVPQFTVIRGDSRLTLNEPARELQLLRDAAPITLGAPAVFVFGVHASNMLGTVTVTANVYGGCPKPSDYARAPASSALYGDLGQSLHAESRNGNLVRVCELLQQGADPNWETPIGSRPLDQAAAHHKGEPTATRILIQFGAEVNYTYGLDQTPLHDAAIRAKYEIVRLLIADRAKVTVANSSGDTPLHIASHDNNSEWSDVIAVMQLLIDKGASISPRNEHERTPLHKALIRNNGQGVPEFLIANGADVNAGDVDGFTPAHWAKTKSHIDALLAADANLNATVTNESHAYYGHTPLDRQSAGEVAEYMWEKGARCGGNRQWSAERKRCR